MAFPPPTLPTNRTNATPQLDAHPGDHNALAAAVNDTTTYVQGLNTQLQTVKSQMNVYGTTQSVSTDAGGTKQIELAPVGCFRSGVTVLAALPSYTPGTPPGRAVVYAANVRADGSAWGLVVVTNAAGTTLPNANVLVSTIAVGPRF